MITNNLILGGYNMINSIKSSVFYHIYPLGFCGVINNKKNYTKKLDYQRLMING